jgi:signal transduction histidine kinase
LPIIFITAKHQLSSLVDSFSAGGNDYISKPITQQELMARVHFHLQLSYSIRALKVAEQQQLRAVLLEKDKEMAEAANRSKSLFLAKMSHEIRTPMNGIIGMTELCLRTPLSTIQKNYLNKVYDSAHFLLEIINEILDFSKIEADRIELETIPFNLESTFADVGSLLSPQAQDKGVALHLEIDPDLPLSLVGDSSRLRQVMMNLIGNGVKFTEWGRVTIQISLLGADDQQVSVRFTVQDTGVGIPDSQIDQVFQPFIQAETSTFRHFGGTGLGLNISQRLVGLMGGRISVESKEGEGSRFTFELALDREQKTNTLASYGQKMLSGLEGKSVAIVIENFATRGYIRVLKLALSHRKHTHPIANMGRFF